MDEDRSFDFVSIGGGAAGFFGAIAFAESAPWARVAILEKTGSVLGKVKISGGGRCNVTHACYEPKPLTTHYPRGEKTLIGPFHRWGVEDTVAWFEARGVSLKTEPDGRIFPTTDRSETIIQCLEKAASDAGVEVIKRVEVTALETTEGRWRVITKSGDEFVAGAVLLATGGTRNQAGARLAGGVGHRLIPAAPSLFTFKIDDPRLEGLAGIAVETVAAKVEGLSLKSSGPCLITHWGLSGPAILKLSAWGARDLAALDYQFTVVINWCGKMDREAVAETLREARESRPKKQVRSGISAFSIPARLWQRLVETAGIDGETTWSNLSKASRLRLGAELTEGKFRVVGKSMNKDEFVTAGGIALGEVNSKTMESRRAPGLYFAGEVLDVDGITGGFNFQSAWTTARIAGEAAATSSL